MAPNVTTLVDSWPEDSYNLFVALEAEDDIFADSTNSLLPSLEESLNSGMAESDFLEGFMDLSSFLGLEVSVTPEEHVLFLSKLGSFGIN